MLRDGGRIWPRPIAIVKPHGSRTPTSELAAKRQGHRQVDGRRPRSRRALATRARRNGAPAGGPDRGRPPATALRGGDHAGPRTGSGLPRSASRTRRPESPWAARSGRLRSPPLDYSAGIAPGAGYCNGVIFWARARDRPYGRLISGQEGRIPNGRKDSRWASRGACDADCDQRRRRRVTGNGRGGASQLPPGAAGRMTLAPGARRQRREVTHSPSG